MDDRSVSLIVALIRLRVQGKYMLNSRHNTLLLLSAAVAHAAGIGFILFGHVRLASVGVVLVVLSLMSLMPVVRFRLDQDSTSGG